VTAFPIDGVIAVYIGFELSMVLLLQTESTISGAASSRARPPSPFSLMA
jgi:hypothetical protein